MSSHECMAENELQSMAAGVLSEKHGDSSQYQHIMTLLVQDESPDDAN